MTLPITYPRPSLKGTTGLEEFGMTRDKWLPALLALKK
jgi:hypothetical protein